MRTAFYWEFGGRDRDRTGEIPGWDRDALPRANVLLPGAPAKGQACADKETVPPPGFVAAADRGGRFSYPL